MTEQTIIISQSFIKAMKEGKCQARAKAIYLDGMESKPSDAMTRGNYFETLLMGATDTGEVVQMERLDSGAKSQAQIRVESQAAKMKSVIKNEFEMNFHTARPHVWVALTDYEDEKGKRIYQLRARLDMVTSMKIGDKVLPNVIVDFKITDSIQTNFGDFAWGFPQAMDHTQAFLYSWAWFMKYNEWIPFWYIVLDLSPKMEYKMVGGQVGPSEISELKQSIRATIAQVEYNFAAENWERTPSYDNCNRCPLQRTCPLYKQGKDLQYLW